MRRFLVLLIFSLFTAAASGQQYLAVDSLKDILRTSKQDTILALALRELSVEYRGFDLDSSLMLGQQALKISERAKFPRGQARSFAALAGTYRLLGELPKAWDHTNRCMQIATENHLYLEQALAFNLMAIIHGAIGDVEKKVHFYKRALDVNQKTADGPLKYEFDAVLLSNIANHFMKEEIQPDSANIYMQRSVEAYEKSHLRPNPLSILSLGRAVAMKDKVRGISIMYRALNVTNQYQNFGDAAAVHAFIAEAFSGLQFDSAVQHAKMGLASALAYRRPIVINRNARILAALFDTVDVKKAYYYQKLADSTYKAVYGPAQTGKVQALIFEELERQGRERLEAEAAQARFKQFVFIGALLILLGVIWVLIRFNRIEKNAKLLLERKNSEIQTAQHQLVQSEKMASLGELTAGIAHEIQNPLNFVNNFSEINAELISELQEAATKGNLDEVKSIATTLEENESKIVSHGKRADAIVKSMLQHSRKSSGQKELTDINALCDEYLRLAYHGLRAKDKSFNAKFETNFDPAVGNITVLPQEIGRVILNLINNAFHAVTEKKKTNGGGYEPTVSVTTKRQNGSVEISVTDNGTGIPSHVKDKIFQPFFTTKPTGQGTGLGLSLSYDIVTKGHQGELKVVTREGEGSTFIVHLPAS